MHCGLNSPLKPAPARALFEWSRRITGYAQPRVWWVQYFGKRPDEVEGGYTGLHQDWTSWSQEVNGTADSAHPLPRSPFERASARCAARMTRVPAVMQSPMASAALGSSPAGSRSLRYGPTLRRFSSSGEVTGGA